tara:strand:- start:94 stop:972 length:879 start_codon:yes stop_codon:yes gene_type:complete
MIVWLASYPKSGNTWLRSIIGQFFEKDFNEDKVFERSKKIRVYPSKIDYLKIDKIFNSKVFLQEQKKEILDKTIINWSLSQEKINLNNDTNYFKTHNMLCKINVNDKLYPFTDLENTIGVIHIVRDPRNILTSLKNHFSFVDDESVLRFMMNEDQTTGLDENKIPQLISSWKNHYNSWKRFPKNNILFKYEDLLFDTKNQILRLANYINNFTKISISDYDIDKIIVNTSFENLKRLEAQGKFDESSINKKTGEIKTFFKMGAKNDWKKLLNDNSRSLIEIKFKHEMIELGYL